MSISQYSDPQKKLLSMKNVGIEIPKNNVQSIQAANPNGQRVDTLYFAKTYSEILAEVEQYKQDNPDEEIVDFIFQQAPSGETKLFPLSPETDLKFRTRIEAECNDSVS